MGHREGEWDSGDKADSADSAGAVVGGRGRCGGGDEKGTGSRGGRRGRRKRGGFLRRQQPTLEQQALCSTQVSAWNKFDVRQRGFGFENKVECLCNNAACSAPFLFFLWKDGVGVGVGEWGEGVTCVMAVPMAVLLAWGIW